MGWRAALVGWMRPQVCSWLYQCVPGMMAGRKSRGTYCSGSGGRWNRWWSILTSWDHSSFVWRRINSMGLSLTIENCIDLMVILSCRLMIKCSCLLKLVNVPSQVVPLPNFDNEQYAEMLLILLFWQTWLLVMFKLMQYHG